MASIAIREMTQMFVGMMKEIPLAAWQARADNGAGFSGSFIKPQSNSLKLIQSGNRCTDDDAKFREFDRAYLAFQTQANFGNNSKEFDKAGSNFFEKAKAINLPEKTAAEIALAAAKKFEGEATGKEPGIKYLNAYEKLFQTARSGGNPKALDRAVAYYTEMGKKVGVPLEIRSKTIVKAWGMFYRKED